MCPLRVAGGSRVLNEDGCAPGRQPQAKQRRRTHTQRPAARQGRGRLARAAAVHGHLRVRPLAGCVRASCLRLSLGGPTFAPGHLDSTCATYNCPSNPSGTSLNAAGSGPGFYCGTCTVFVYRGQTLTAATVGLPGTTRSGGRTMLWLADPSGNYVASNWYYQNTYNSYLTWTATSSGTYTIYEGEPAFSQQSSIGNAAGFTNVQATVGWTLTALPMPPPTLPPPPQIQYNQCPQFSYQQALPGQQSPPYITNMNNGVVFANCNFNANAGQVVQFGAAQMPGAQYSGPVVLWLRSSAGTVMTGSGTGTPMIYTIPTSGQYSIWEGCSDWRSSCSATVGAWRGRGGAAAPQARRADAAAPGTQRGRSSTRSAQLRRPPPLRPPTRTGPWAARARAPPAAATPTKPASTPTPTV
jgi:hypothetical protein